ncbi:MAG: proline racemase family protein [Anaerolineae bacterium]
MDSHTAGECTRLVTSGLLPIPGDTMAEKLAYAEDQLRWVPGFLLLEPRGHKDMFGAILTPPCSPEADVGAVFMDNQGYEPMCGHAVIGTATTVLETGMVPMSEPETLVSLHTPSGLVRAYARIEDGRVMSVSFENVPAFVYRSDLRLRIPGVGTLTVDVVFGGLFFVFVDARQLTIDLVPANAARLADLGMRILEVANREVEVRHPELSHIDRIIDVRFYVDPGPDGTDSRNVVILGDHMIDRSPCGTGTSAEAALRHAQGRLEVGGSFVTESIIGTRFTGRILAETTVGSGAESFPAVVPRITGSAHLTGFHQFVLDGGDPFPQGFRLGE